MRAALSVKGCMKLGTSVIPDSEENVRGLQYALCTEIGKGSCRALSKRAKAWWGLRDRPRPQCLRARRQRCGAQPSRRWLPSTCPWTACWAASLELSARLRLALCGCELPLFTGLQDTAECPREASIVVLLCVMTSLVVSDRSHPSNSMQHCYALRWNTCCSATRGGEK